MTVARILAQRLSASEILRRHADGRWEPRAVLERFDEKWVPEPNTGCWLWIGGVQPLMGYGRFWMGAARRSAGAHKVSWELRRGPVPPGLQVLHKCDVPCCVNPDHLYLGTHQDNMDDKVARGRVSRGHRHASTVHHQVRGEKDGASKLTEDKVRELRQLGESGWTLGALGRHFGITRQSARAVLRREVWRHVA